MRSFVFAVLMVLAHAQFPPTPEGVTVVKSKFHEGVTISYKDVSHFNWKCWPKINTPSGLEDVFRWPPLSSILLYGHDDFP